MRLAIPLSLIGFLCLATGCQATRGPAVIAAWQSPRPANLALGHDPDENWLATDYAGRPDWPAVDHGYRFDEVTYFGRAYYDYQSGYNRYGGLHYGNYTVQSGVWVR